MSRKPKRFITGSGRSTPREPRPRQHRFPALRPAVLALGVGAAVWWAWSALHPRAREPLPFQAWEEGKRLADAKLLVEAIPHLRRAVSRSAPFTQHFDFGVVLHNAATSSHAVLGLDVPVTRSSVERVALMRECLYQTSLAETLASASADKAFMAVEKGSGFETWGLLGDAWMEYRRASMIAPADVRIVPRGISVERQIRGEALPKVAGR